MTLVNVNGNDTDNFWNRILQIKSFYFILLNLELVLSHKLLFFDKNNF